MMTEEQIVARLLAGRLDKPPAPKPPPKPEVKANEVWDKDRRQTIARNAATSAEAFAKVVQEDTYEARRRRQQAKEMAEWSSGYDDPRTRYQRELDRFWQAKKDIEAAIEDDYVEIGGFREPRYKTTCHRGKGDPDYGTY
jgi:hypothetical protein